MKAKDGYGMIKNTLFRKGKLVVEYDKEAYDLEVSRLKECLIEDYVGNYGAEGFDASESNPYKEKRAALQKFYSNVAFCIPELYDW